MNEQCHQHVMHIVSGDLWAGAEVQLFALASVQHQRSGMEVSVVIFNAGRLERDLRNAGINVVVLDETQLSSIGLMLKLIRIIHDLAPDIIHTHRTKENILGSIAAVLNGKPSIRTAHGAAEHAAPLLDIPKRIIRFLDRACGRFLQKKVIAVSGDLAGILAGDFSPGRIHVIENGIDIESLTGSLQKPRGQVASSALNVGIAGRLVPVKRVDLFIQTAKYLHDNASELDLHFHVYGEGPLRDELMELARSLDTVSYLHFEDHCDDIYRALQDLDMLIMTSDHEGLPMVLLESMVLETPIIAHRVGGITKLLDDGRCGILVEDHSEEGYARAIRLLGADAEFRQEIARRARKRVSEHYSAIQNAEKYCDVYRALLEE